MCRNGLLQLSLSISDSSKRRLLSTQGVFIKVVVLLLFFVCNSWFAKQKKSEMDFLRSIWARFSQLCGCTEDISTQAYEPNEGTHLLADPTNSLRINSHSENYQTEKNFQNCQSLPQREEQNALCRLVQNTAINMIDVGAMDTHNLEHQEYNDRIKLYSQRLQQQWSNLQHPNRTIIGLLKDVPSPENLLLAMPAPEDLVQMENALNMAQAALIDIRVQHKEAVVVPFKIL